MNGVNPVRSFSAMILFVYTKVIDFYFYPSLLSKSLTSSTSFLVSLLVLVYVESCHLPAWIILILFSTFHPFDFFSLPNSCVQAHLLSHCVLSRVENDNIQLKKSFMPDLLYIVLLCALCMEF